MNLDEGLVIGGAGMVVLAILLLAGAPWALLVAGLATMLYGVIR